MAGEQPPDYNRRNPKSPDTNRRPNEARPEQEQPASPRQRPPEPQRNGNRPPPAPTWRPGNSGKDAPVRQPANSQGNNSRPATPPPAINRNGRSSTPPVSPDPSRQGQPPPPAKASGRGYQPLPPSTNRERRPDTNPPPAPSGRRNRATPPTENGPGRNELLAPAVRRRQRNSARRNVLLYGGITALVVGIIVVLFVITRITSFLSGISVERVDQNGAPVNNSSVGGRVNILLLGLDLRPNDKENGTRSDTMILVSVDRNNKAASMLSVPRDLWVDIPGHGANRINASYFFGEQDRPGQGGPPLAKATISKLLGINIDYFVQVDFNGFRQIVDAIGGITIDVKKPLIDNEYPTEDFGTKRLYIPAGIQHMDGKTALEYARSRHGDSDLGRNQRQQAVLLAVREQGINLGAVTNNDLQSALQGAIKTDLQTGDILGLVNSAIGMNKDNIRTFSIDANLARQSNVDGNDVLLPDKAGIQALVSQVTSSPAAPAKESANISVLNGTFTEGRASRTQKFLEDKGYSINNVAQASDAGKYPNTIIRVYNNKQKTAGELANLLGLAADKVQAKGSGGPPGIDIEIVCGEDLKLPL